MDLYHSVHGHDESTFDIQDTHRLPAVSAAQALEDLDDDPARCVSTGLDELDRALASSPEGTREARLGGRPGGEHSSQTGTGGVPRGQVTEIWGPPGVGKTAMGIQIAASALSDGHGVVWVDCAYPVCGRRLTDVVRAVRSSKRPDKSASGEYSDQQTEPEDEDDVGEGLVHYTCATLAHFVALLCRPVASSIPPNTSVVVVDSLTALLTETFPKAPDSKRETKSGKGSGLSTKKLQTLQHIISALGKLAATRNCAVVLLSQCATRMQSLNRGAAIHPGITAGVWEQGLGARVGLFRDWAWEDGVPRSTCFASLQRLGGRAVSGALGPLCAFRIESTGLVPVDYDDAERQHEEQGDSGRPQLKRKLAEARTEVPDSDEDYGWGSEDDAHLPPEPPQWQGSEDLIIGTQRSVDGEEESGGEDEGGEEENEEEHPPDDRVADS